MVNFYHFWEALVLTQQGEEGLALVAVQMEAPGGVLGGSLGARLGCGGVLCGALEKRGGREQILEAPPPLPPKTEQTPSDPYVKNLKPSPKQQ